MSDKQRITIRCWNTPSCGRTYTWLATFGGQPTLLIACPFCGAEAAVPLAPWVDPLKDNLAGGDAPTPPPPEPPAYTLDRLRLPDVLPSEPRPAAPEGQA